MSTEEPDMSSDLALSPSWIALGDDTPEVGQVVEFQVIGSDPDIQVGKYLESAQDPHRTANHRFRFKIKDGTLIRVNKYSVWRRYEGPPIEAFNPPVESPLPSARMNTRLFVSYGQEANPGVYIDSVWAIRRMMNMVEMVKQDLNFLISATPSGVSRNHMCDANIQLEEMVASLVKVTESLTSPTKGSAGGTLR